MHTQQGFTLLELLLALAISAIVAAGAATLFRSSVNAQHRLIEQTQNHNQITKALRVLQRDLSQWVPDRPIRNAFGQLQPSIEVTLDNALEFTRSGWQSSRFLSYQRSSLQRVRYEVTATGTEHCPLPENDDNLKTVCLVRAFRAHLDDSGSLNWQYQTILHSVNSIEWRFLLDDASELTSQLPPQDTSTPETHLIPNLKGVNISILMANEQRYSQFTLTPSFWSH